MKKSFLLVVLAIIVGSLFGSILYKAKDVNATALGNAYFLEEGIYSSLELANRNTGMLKNKIIIKNNKKYYVYVGITGNLDNANNIIKMYSKKGFKIIKVQKNIYNETFIYNMKQFDLLLDDNDDFSEIEKIEEVVLDSYLEFGGV